MIIVEGCDNAGKTTLVSQLSGELKLLTICNRRRPESIERSWDYFTAIMIAAQEFPTIFDRWQPISEPIYGPICRNTHLFSMTARIHQLKEMHDRFGMEALLIYCRPSLKKILDFGEREQMDGVIANAQAIVSKYDEDMLWIHHTFDHITVVRYDYEQPGAYDEIKRSAAAHLEKVYA